MRAAALTILAGAACLAALGLFYLTVSAMAQTPNAVATPGRAATLQVATPASPADVFLDVYLKSYRPPPKGAVEAVVSIGTSGGDIEVGRISIFPAEAFTVTSPRDQRAYRFDASTALEKIASGAANLTVKVTLVSEDGKTAPPGAELAVDKIAFSPRP